MIEAPERQIEDFAKAGADSITFHEEATPHANRTLHAIRELGCLAGIAINPGTPVEALAELRGLADIVLCMTVNPGWGGQAFIESSPDKVERLRAAGRRGQDRGRRRHRPEHRRLRSPPPAPPSSSPAPPSSAPPTRRQPTANRRGRRRRLTRAAVKRMPGRPTTHASPAGDQGSGDLLPPGPLGAVDAAAPARRSHQSASARRPPIATTSSARSPRSGRRRGRPCAPAPSRRLRITADHRDAVDLLGAERVLAVVARPAAP